MPYALSNFMMFFEVFFKLCSNNKANWISWMDMFLLILCGGIPWQPYYQRALSVRSHQDARILSVVATFICISCMIPPVLIGGAAKVANVTVINDDTSLILPTTLKILLPEWVSLITLAAICAAAMSSVDSSLLSGASYLAHNVFNAIIWPTAGKKTQVLAFRLIVVILGIAATLLSLKASTIYGLWVLAGDLGYVIVFPQFLAAVHFPAMVNRAGSIAAALIGIILRLLIGEPLIDLKPVIRTTDESGELLFPSKTVLMLISLAVLMIVSRLFRSFRPKNHQEYALENVGR